MVDRDIQRRLELLRREGYRFLRTDDDGDTWVGTHDVGLPLDRLIHNEFFRGRVVVELPAYGPGVPT